MIKKTYEYLTGRYHPDLVPYKSSNLKLIHHEVISPLEKLRKELKKYGFEMFVLSGHRNHLDQLRIWNEKVEGKRPILSADGLTLDTNKLSDEDIVKSICRWSAIPGASRHHWGTDIDVICKKSTPTGYDVKLTADEVCDDGIFGKFHLKLDELLESGHPFFRPYAKDNGGVLPERWHLSFYPIAQELMSKYSIEVFERNIEETNLHLKEVLLHELEYFYNTFVLNVSSPKNV